MSTMQNILQTNFPNIAWRIVQPSPFGFPALFNYLYMYEGDDYMIGYRESMGWYVYSRKYQVLNGPMFNEDDVINHIKNCIG